MNTSNTQSQVIFAIDIRSGEDVSEASIKEIFSIAASNAGSVKLLRIASPEKFRQEIIKPRLPGNKYTESYELVTNDNIKEVELLLANPYSDPFLRRMDEEEKENYLIWWVRDQIFRFTRGLLNLPRSQRVKIAFHHSPLIWNISIASNQVVVARAYHGKGIGHDDSVAELRVKAGGQAKIAETLIAYYESVKHNKRTQFIRNDNDLKTESNFLGKWPSLFKGNAIYPEPNDKRYIHKACCSVDGQNSEEDWLSSEIKGEYFHPAVQERPLNKNKYWEGRTSKIHKINGITAFELVWHLQQVGKKYPMYISKLGYFIGSIVCQALLALEEFRNKSEYVTASVRIKKYPWEKQLIDALESVEQYLPNNTAIFEESIEEIKGISKELEKEETHRFRDAHLKNRIIEINSILRGDDKSEDYDYTELLEFIDKRDEYELDDWLRQSTHDIDFESCYWKVTEWDDPFHVLTSPFLGLSPHESLEKGLDLLKDWGISPDEEKEKFIWKTLLCRSLREFCRRIWYNHVMPNTYKKRYEKEDGEHFLKLTKAALGHINQYPALKDMVGIFEDKQIWKNYPNEKIQEKVVAKKLPIYRYRQISGEPQKNIDRTYQVFLSYNSKDLTEVIKLGEALKERGLSVWLDKWELRPGLPWMNTIERIITTCKSAAICFGDNGIGPWEEPEMQALLGRFVKEKKSGSVLPVIPILLPNAPKEVNLPLFFSDLESVDLRPGLTKELLDKIQWGVTGKNPKP